MDVVPSQEEKARRLNDAKMQEKREQDRASRGQRAMGREKKSGEGDKNGNEISSRDETFFSRKLLCNYGN